MECKQILILFILIGMLVCVNGRLPIDRDKGNNPFDQALYEEVLDAEECRRQVSYITRNNTLLFARFLDAGIKIPRGIFEGVSVDLGNYFQCLGINEKVGDMQIDGKYCMMVIPSQQDLYLPSWPPGSVAKFDHNMMDEETMERVDEFKTRMIGIRALKGIMDTDNKRSSPGVLGNRPYRLAICVPKPCTTQEYFSNVLFNISAVGFEYDEEFCRLPNDKPWVAADYVAVSLISVICFLALLSTCYDLHHTFILKKDPKQANELYTYFSVYTNTRRLVTFRSNPNSLECIDGIRVIAMSWIILGHGFSLYNFTSNLVYALRWLVSEKALFITTGQMAVDTFFTITGILLVYTTAGKLTGSKLLNSLHLFYINRLLRMFPLLAFVILLEASVFHRIADGPYWMSVAENAQNCRTFWWATILHIQNYATPNNMCIPHSWYIAIDIQLYILSPLILYWVLSDKKHVGWTALTVGLVTVLTASTVFNFYMEMPSSNFTLVRLAEQAYYMKNYYFNTLSRGGGFIIGMICGYLLHLSRGKDIQMKLGTVILLWLAMFGAFGLVIYSTYVIKQLDWDNQTVDSLVNSFVRPIWAAGTSWCVFACVKGYGGPINWFLSLQVWKLPSRLSYAMYLYHYSLMFIMADMQLAPNFFSIPNFLFEFLGHFSLTFLMSFVVMVIIDAPFGTLFKLMMGSGPKKSPPEEVIRKEVSNS